MPNSMIVKGSVMTAGGSFIAGGGVLDASDATISLRRAMIAGQWYWPMVSAPTAHPLPRSNSAVGISSRRR
jgi:hypothetical protein